MNDTKKAGFDFISFKINTFSFKESAHPPAGLNVTFDPKGVYDERSGEFTLEMTFTAFDEDQIDNPACNAIIAAHFKFDNPVKFAEIPNYFFPNCIAMTYPYLRSFVGSMTLQAGVKLIMLPVMNLTGLENTLRANTTIVTN